MKLETNNPHQNLMITHSINYYTRATILHFLWRTTVLHFLCEEQVPSFLILWERPENYYCPLSLVEVLFLLHSDISPSIFLFLVIGFSSNIKIFVLTIIIFLKSAPHLPFLHHLKMLETKCDLIFFDLITFPFVWLLYWVRHLCFFHQSIDVAGADLPFNLHFKA